MTSRAHTLVSEFFHPRIQPRGWIQGLAGRDDAIFSAESLLPNHPGTGAVNWGGGK